MLALLWALVTIGLSSWAIAHDRYTQPVPATIIALKNLEHQLSDSGDIPPDITLLRFEVRATVALAELNRDERDWLRITLLATSLVLGLLAITVLARGRFERRRGMPDDRASPSIADSPSN